MADHTTGPRRRCVACRNSAPADGLVRIAWPAGAPCPAVGRTLPGRGAWVHPVPACLDALRPGDLARALRRSVTAADLDGLALSRVLPADTGPSGDG